MKKNLKYYLVALIAICVMMVGVVFGNNDTYAIETTLTVSPMEQKMTLYPGEASTGSIKVSNQASATEKLFYKVDVVPFTRSGSNYDVTVEEELGNGTYNDIVSWVTFSADHGSLEPNETDEITYTVNVPSDANGGGQYFAILVTRTEDPNKSGEDGNVSLNEIIRIASTVYTTISGKDMQLSGAIRENNIASFFLAPPIKSSFVVENTGNTHMEINYYMQVFPLFSDEEVYTNEEDPGYAIVLPGTSRYIEQEWNETPGIGIFKVRQVAKFGSDESNKSVTEKMVIVCPVWLLFLVLFVIIALVIWIVMKIRSKGNKKAREHEPATTE